MTASAPPRLRALGALRRSARRALTWLRRSAPRRLYGALSARFAGVPTIETRALADWLARPTAERPLLLDARAPEEFAVSHLAGARRIDPSATEFSELGVERTAAIVVYCSVGYRSGLLCQRLQAAGYADARNLAGGIFQWANEERPLHRGAERVQRVHPFDARWGALLLPEHRNDPKGEPHRT